MAVADHSLSTTHERPRARLPAATTARGGGWASASWNGCVVAPYSGATLEQRGVQIRPRVGRPNATTMRSTDQGQGIRRKELWWTSVGNVTTRGLTTYG